MRNNQPFNQIRVLIADDTSGDREDIKNNLETLFRNIDFEVIFTSNCKDSINVIENRSTFDLAFIDVLFVQESNKFEDVLDAINNRQDSDITQSFLVSAYYDQPETLHINSNHKGTVKISKRAKNYYEHFSNIVTPKMRSWSEFKLAQLCTSDIIKIMQIVNSKNFNEESVIEIKNEKWKAKNLFPFIIINNSSFKSDVILEFIKDAYTFIPKYLIGKGKLYTTNQFKLPIQDYYRELYRYHSELIEKEINTISHNFLDLVFKCYIFDLLVKEKSDTKYNKLLDKYSSILMSSKGVGQYTTKIGGRNDWNQRISKKAMETFVYKLAGRQSSIVMYIYFDFTPHKISNILMQGNYKLMEDELYEGVNVRALLSTNLFLKRFSVTKREERKWEEFNEIIDINCSRYEIEFVKKWYANSLKYLKNTREIEESDKKFIEGEIDSYIRNYVTRI